MVVFWQIGGLRSQYNDSNTVMPYHTMSTGFSLCFTVFFPKAPKPLSFPGPIAQISVFLLQLLASMGSTKANPSDGSRYRDSSGDEALAKALDEKMRDEKSVFIQNIPPRTFARISSCLR